jgi:REP element-mobilizing transposase RayT
MLGERIGYMADLKYRKSIRFSDYDYTKHGMYFVTICSKNAERIFSDIKDDSVLLSEIGQIIENAVLNIPGIYKNVKIDCYVIMPNHIHVILTFDADPSAKRISLSTVINQFKGFVTKQIGYSPWHKLFYEHIIRDHSDYLRIVDYINDNPKKWREDRFFDD